MQEPVRLVIWDLDETFWGGTHAEGPVEHIAANHEIVKDLARRGIVSSICSKNDFARVKSTLLAAGIWDYFVLPSINWDAKGPRIRSTIDSIGLRPASVMFIDDNPSNLEEAKRFCPELQVAGVDRIRTLLTDPLFAGKADPELTRLAQYQVLERRKADESAAGGDIESFLRDSGIRVEIHYELAEHLDRIIDLVNRSNQLNFTKRRLAQDPAAARRELIGLLASHEIQAGLLHVVDRYGDHGYSGFYVVRHDTELVHFCFSCRLLGMGIETWLYRRLGRPRLQIVPEVLSNPIQDSRSVDWVTLIGPTGTGPAAAESPVVIPLDWMAAHGGCDLQALSHYFKVSSPEVIGEFNVGRNGFDARVDHSMFLRYALTGIDPGALQECQKIGYRAEDFKTALSQPHAGRGLIILSFWADVSYALYRHRRLNFILPFAVSGRSNHALDGRTAGAEELPDHLRNSWMATALSTLAADYDFVGVIDERTFKSNLSTVFDSIPGNTPVVILLGNTQLRDRERGVTHTSGDNVRFNQWIVDTAVTRPHVTVLNVRDAIQSEDEVTDWSHFDRIVYYRLYQRIARILSAE